MSKAEPESQNTLSTETSPYLLQHADNPVHWLPWGDEAFRKAETEHKPVFLSIGYSSCHWCHVMEHESFEDQDVAALLNAVAVCIKVDREERPDVDDLYMTATQVMTGRGGWPNSVWLMPDRRPWYAGTYYPKPTFMALLKQVDVLWKTKREAIEEQAHELTQVIQEQTKRAPAHTTDRSLHLDEAQLELAERQLLHTADPTNGGFGTAPKFPPHASLRFLLSRPENPETTIILTTTLDHMAAGGIRDHIGGGFHRYATDPRWFLPHFEKMLYDNAQLLWVYAKASSVLNRPEYAQVATDLYHWATETFRDPGEDIFYSAYDADSEGEEGKFYLWTHDEILTVLGKEEGRKFAKRYNITPEGNYVEEATGKRTHDNIPHLHPEHLDLQGEDWILAAKAKLNRHRHNRTPPFLDDKHITAWNGLMLSGLARAGAELHNSDMIQQAERTADAILRHLKHTDHLYRSRRKGTSSGQGFLDDYAYLADGLIELYGVTQNQRWLSEATTILQRLDAAFSNEAKNGYYFTSTDHEQLLHRPLDPYDNATPSANAVAARAWFNLAKFTDAQDAFSRGEAILLGFTPWITRAAAASMTFHEVLQQYLDLKDDLGAGGDGALSFDLRAEEDDRYVLTITIPEGSHILAKTAQPESPQTPLAFTLVTPEGKTELVPRSFPEAHELPPIGSVYTSTITLPFTIDPQTAEERRLDVRWQRCTDNVCLPPETIRLVIPSPIF